MATCKTIDVKEIIEHFEFKMADIGFFAETDRTVRKGEAIMNKWFILSYLLDDWKPLIIIISSCMESVITLR